jgi:predicted cupin superfamily sugar epimerase
MLSAAEVMRLLDLKPLPGEGGFYRETYRASDRLAATALPDRYTTAKSACTAMYYLLAPDTFSALHRLPTDEVYHFYAGDPVEMLLLHAHGVGEVITLGNDLESGHRPQYVVSRGVWQGSRVRAGGTWSLLGTTMAPGFDFADFEAGDRRTLAAAYPAYMEMIGALTRARLEE